MRRREARLTQAALASEVGLDRSAVTKIERGERRVSALELVALGRALDVPLAWLLSDPPHAVLSRRRDPARGGSTGRLDHLIERCARDVEMLRERDLLAAPPDQVRLPAIGSPAEAADAAAKVREHLGVGFEPLHDLVATAEALGLLAFVLDVQDPDEGAYVALEDWGVAVVNGDAPSGRRRFTLAHEIGHHVLGDACAIDGPARTEAREQVVDAFAVHLLLPLPATRRRWEALSGRDRPREAALRLAIEYRLSWSALIPQLERAGVIDGADASGLLREEPRSGDYRALGLAPPESLIAPRLAPGYEQAVLRGYRGEEISPGRALELLHGVLDSHDLPALAPLREDALYDELTGPAL